MYKIFVVGTGYVGTAIARYFQEKNQRVYALVRNDDRVSELKSENIQPVVADLTVPEMMQDLPAANFIVLCPAPGERTEKGYEEIYLRGIGNILKAIPTRPDLIVYLSSTSVYGEASGAWVDEETICRPGTKKGKILLEAERQVLGCGYPAVVLRCAGIYGPGRNRIGAVEKNEIHMTAEKDTFSNFIHRDDIVYSMPLLFKKAEVGQVYLGSDGFPVRKSEMIQWLAKRLGKEIQIPKSFTTVTGKRCRSDKLKGLGFRFTYPDFKVGYESFLPVEMSRGKETSR